MEIFNDFLATNPYFSAGFGLLGVGSALAVARQGAARVGFFLQQYCIMKLEIPSKDPSYTWVLNWLASNSLKTQQLSVRTMMAQRANGTSHVGFMTMPSPGVHYIKWNGRWLKVNQK